MAKTKVSEFDAVASNNTDINSVNVAEGCPPSGINNAIREMASLLKKQEVGTDAMTSPDIDGGTIDGATIGGSSGVTIGVSDGTVSAPSIKFTSDTNTGIYRGGTDILKFVTAGQDRLTILANGDTGIGTSSPAFAVGGGLQVKGSSFTSVRVTSGGNTGIDFSQTTSGVSYLYNRDNADLIFGTNDTERMRITSGGDVLAKTNDARIGSDVGSVEYGTSTANSVRFYSDNSERMRISSGGQVSLATTDATHGFNVGQSGTDFRGRFQGSNQYRLGLQNGTSNLVWLGSGGADNFRISNSAGSTRFEIDSSGNGKFEGSGDCTLSITANSTSNDSKIDFVHGSTIDGGITYDHNGAYASEKMVFRAGNNGSHMFLTGDGVLLVGQTSFAYGDVGCSMTSSGQLGGTANGDTALVLNRKTSEGTTAQFRYDNNVVAGIAITNGGNILSINGLGSGLGFHKSATTNIVYPFKNNTTSDDVIDLGSSGVRFDDVYATNGTIQTSDRNEKNTITDSDLGIDFIKRLTPKSYIFNGKTRTHYGLIAQDVETVLGDISKPTSGFAGFIKTDISEEQDGSEYRYGLRYTEFVAPLIQAVKDQQATIDALTARITALENGE